MAAARKLAPNVVPAIMQRPHNVAMLAPAVEAIERAARGRFFMLGPTIRATFQAQTFPP
jgi:hypothetical protein